MEEWSLPKDDYVTTLYFGDNERKLESENYKDFSVGKKINVAIRAVLVIENRIFVGIWFPENSVDNELPNMTLLIKKW